jgi:hypothetical protein
MNSHPPASPSTLATGGTLARVPFEVSRAGLFLHPSRTSQGAPCSVPLTRDARSSRGSGFQSVGAKRANCMRDRRGASGRISGFPRRLRSIIFREAAHQFRAHDSNRNEAGLVLRSPVRKAGAAVNRRHSPAESRPPIPIKVDDLTHKHFSYSVSHKQEFMESGYAEKCKSLWHNGG